MSNVNNKVIFEGFSGSEIQEMVKTYGKKFSVRVNPDGTQVISKAFTADLIALLEGSKGQLDYDLKIVEVISDNIGELEYRRDYLDAVISNKELNKDEVLHQLRIADEACERMLRGLTEESLIGVSAEINIDLPIVKEFVAKVAELQAKVDEFRATL